MRGSATRVNTALSLERFGEPFTRLRGSAIAVTSWDNDLLGERDLSEMLYYFGILALEVTASSL